MGRINPTIAIGIPTWGRVTTRWSRAYRHLGGPLGSTMAEFEIKNTPIAEARNALMAQAIESGADFLFMLGDDVLPPGDAIIQLWHRMQANPDLHLATGVYWTKQWPTAPYLWNVMQRGPYLDWKVGEWFPVDFAGCDCLLIRLSDEVKALGPEWFSTQWLWDSDQEKPSELATEDFYFYTKARRAGLKLWADTGVQCFHEDRQTELLFGLTTDMPQAGGVLPSLPPAGTELSPVVPVVADVGCGSEAPFFGEAGTVRVLRFDGNPKVLPDYRCDLRALPVPDRCVDVVHSRHALEHFGRGAAIPALREWLRILRVGGELRLCLPNALDACRRIVAIEGGELEPDHYPWWQLYGRQDDEYDLHRNGFTPRRLRTLLDAVGCLRDITVREGDDGRNLYATATKASHPAPDVLVPEWDGIAEQEGITIAGVKPRADGARPPVHVDTKIQADRLIDEALPRQGVVEEGALV